MNSSLSFCSWPVAAVDASFNEQGCILICLLSRDANSQLHMHQWNEHDGQPTSNGVTGDKRQISTRTENLYYNHFPFCISRCITYRFISTQMSNDISRFLSPRGIVAPVMAFCVGHQQLAFVIAFEIHRPRYRHIQIGYHTHNNISTTDGNSVWSGSDLLPIRYYANWFRRFGLRSTFGIHSSRHCCGCCYCRMLSQPSKENKNEKFGAFKLMLMAIPDANKLYCCFYRRRTNIFVFALLSFDKLCETCVRAFAYWALFRP